MVPELLRAMDRASLRFDCLKGVITYSEQVPMGLREEISARLGVLLEDIYSSREIGYIALECPEHNYDHVQAETVLVEITDDKDRPCPIGEVGRVVVTPLQNFAMPLIRYAISDYAEFGPPCPCGRGLPVIRNIHGRARNMPRLPSGEGKWLILAAALEQRMRGLPMIQYQLIQPAFSEIDVSIVPVRPLYDN
jgi:phenylacetate-CoA ligase